MSLHVGQARKVEFPTTQALSGNERHVVALGQQCSKLIGEKPSETIVPIFFRTRNDSIIIEQRPSLLVRFWRFITLRAGQYRLANCATKLQNLFTKESVAQATTDQTTLHNSLLLISATKETIRRYEAKRKTLPESVESLKESIDTFTQGIFNTLHAQAGSEEKKLLYRWAENYIKEKVKTEETVAHVSKVSNQLFIQIREEDHQFSKRLKIALPLLEEDQQRELTDRYTKFQAAKKWKREHPLETLIERKISRFNTYLEAAEKAARKQFFDKFAQKNNLANRSHYLNLSSTFEQICEKEMHRNAPLGKAFPGIEQTLTKFNIRLDQAESEKREDLERQKRVLIRKLTALEKKGEPKALELLTDLIQPTNSFLSMAQQVAQVTKALSILNKERLCSFMKGSIDECRLSERCHDLEERGSNLAQPLIQELEEIRKTITLKKTEEESSTAIITRLKKFNQKLTRAEKNYFNSILDTTFGKNDLTPLQLFLDKHLQKLTEAATRDPTNTKTETLRTLQNPPITLKVRYREGRVQALLYKEMDIGILNTIYCVASLLGPKIHESIGPVYSYAKLPRIEMARGPIKGPNPPLTPRGRMSLGGIETIPNPLTPRNKARSGNRTSLGGTETIPNLPLTPRGPRSVRKSLGGRENISNNLPFTPRDRTKEGNRMSLKGTKNTSRKPSLTTSRGITREDNSLQDYVFLDHLKNEHFSHEIPQDTKRINYQKKPNELKGLVMEWVDEEKKMLSKLEGAQQYLTKLQLAQKFCTCLTTIHDQNLCHLHVKPEQLLISEKTVARKRTVRLSDNSFAQQKGIPLHQPVEASSYTAPELLLDKELVSPTMDCWSLGISLGELFYGQSFNKLHTSDKVKEIKANWATSQGKDKYTLWCTLCQQMITDLPTTGESKIIKGLLDPNPESRWTAEQAEKAFAQLLQP